MDLKYGIKIQFIFWGYTKFKIFSGTFTIIQDVRKEKDKHWPRSASPLWGMTKLSLTASLDFVEYTNEQRKCWSECTDIQADQSLLFVYAASIVPDKVLFFFFIKQQSSDIFSYFPTKNICYGYSSEVPCEVLLMSTYNIYFCGEISEYLPYNLSLI